MKVLFIFRDIDSAEPIGVMYISALLKKNGHTVKFLWTRGIDLLKEVIKYKPDIIGYSITTGVHKYYLKINKFLKKHYNFISIFGGPHATLFPEMINEEDVDIICRGEGEYASLELCNNLSWKKNINKIKNLWVKENKKIYKNKLRPLIKNLDELPFPDRESRYLTDKRNRSYPAKSFITNRGCPYNCTYCFNPAFQKIYGKEWAKTRTRSPKNIVKEIEEVKSTASLKFLQFRCSIFPSKIDWLEEFADIYSKRINLPFYCHVHVNHLNEKVICLLVKAGCKSVNMGIECGDEEYRKKVLKRSMSNQRIVEVCSLLHKYGISILADNILGLPGQNLEMDIKTFKLNVECKIDYPLAMLLQPYPGTEIGDYCIKNNYFDKDYSKMNYNYYYSSPLKFKNPEEKKKIENFQKLFALVKEIPWTLELVKFLVKLPFKTFYNTIFRCWYAFCYHKRIMPFKLSLYEIKETIESLIGIYKKEAFSEKSV